MVPALLPFVFAIFWASSYAAAKIGLADITPYAFVAIRLTLAAAAALILVQIFGRSWEPVKARWLPYSPFHVGPSFVSDVLSIA